MYAIIKTGGKQLRVSEGQVIYTEKIKANSGDKVTFDKVILVGENKNIKVGKPLVDGAKVIGTVQKQGHMKKVVTFKYKPKKHQHTKHGHRQPYTKILIDKIDNI